MRFTAQLEIHAHKISLPLASLLARTLAPNIIRALLKETMRKESMCASLSTALISKILILF